MPSSTSSSSPLWPGTWILTVAIVIVCIGAWELSWRSRGFVPSYVDDAALWALARERAVELGEDAVVLVGSSRMQMDIHRETFADATGLHPAIQLAAVRGPSVPVLRSLAQDPDFRGTVIMEINPVLFFAHTPRIDQVLQDYVAVHERFGWSEEIEQRLRMFVQHRMVLRLPALAPSPLWQAWQAGRFPQPKYNDVITSERFRYGDYRKFSSLPVANRINAQLMARTVPRTLGPEGLRRRIDDVSRWAKQIESRGGKVIFLHLPSSLHVLEFEERHFARHLCWDVLAENIDAPTIHYQDHPRLMSFVPPDGDHLDLSQAIRFSMIFGEILVQEGHAPGPGAGSR